MAIKRIWHGWTTPEQAEAYQALLLEEVIPGIEAKRIPGFAGIEVLRQHRADQDHADEVEFITIMTFASLANVVAFQGADYARSYVPDAARAVLKRWDETAAHYEVVDTQACAPVDGPMD